MDQEALAYLPQSPGYPDGVTKLGLVRADNTGHDNTLAYIDQGSFLALRALGRQPIMQFVWIYEHGVDLDGLRQFQRNLNDGLLGRHIETSPLPFGRHRWVAHPGPTDLEIAPVDMPREQVWEWADERIGRLTDPEHGPAWHLGVQPLIEGGAAVSLVVSHSVADAIGLCEAIADAARGDHRDLDYPSPGARTYIKALKEDLLIIARSVPDIARAVTATVRTVRASQDERPPAGPKKPRTKQSRLTHEDDHSPVVAPSATAWIDLDLWDRRAEGLGGTSNSLFAGLATRLAVLMGRQLPDNRVLLSWPVSIRTAGDTRANALTAALMTADSTVVTNTLRAIRSDMKTALTTTAKTSKDQLATMGVVQFTPKVLVRRLEAMIGDLSAVGCSNLGELDSIINRPDGTDADRMTFRSLEPQITKATLDRTHGYLYLGSGRVNGRIFISTNGWVPGESNTKECLRARLQTAITEMGLTAEIE